MKNGEVIAKLVKATTVSYREGDAESCEQALDKVCDAVCVLIEELRAEHDPMAYHRCPVCKKPMKRVETENHGPGWVFDCKCLDSQSDAPCTCRTVNDADGARIYVDGCLAHSSASQSDAGAKP